MQKSKAKYSDEEFLKGVAAGGADRERSVNLLFDTYSGYVAKAVRTHRISEEEALDAYTDAVIVVVDKVIGKAFRGESKVSTFLFRIFSNKIVDRVRHHSTDRSERNFHWTDELPELPDTARSILKDMITQQEVEGIQHLMDKLGEDCRKLIWETEYWDRDLADIAQELNLSNARSASTKKYRCMDKLRELIRKKKIRLT